MNRRRIYAMFTANTIGKYVLPAAARAFDISNN